MRASNQLGLAGASECDFFYKEMIGPWILATYIPCVYIRDMLVSMKYFIKNMEQLRQRIL